MKKIKTIGAISFALIGGGTLVGIPLSMSSCKKGDIKGEDGKIFTGNEELKSTDSMDSFLKKYAQTPPEADFRTTSALGDDVTPNKADYTSQAMANYLNKHLNTQVMLNCVISMMKYSSWKHNLGTVIYPDSSKVKGDFDGILKIKMRTSSGYTETHEFDYSSTDHKSANGVKYEGTAYDGRDTTHINLNFSSAWGGGFNLTQEFNQGNAILNSGKTFSFQTDEALNYLGTDIWVKGLSISPYDWTKTYFRDISSPLLIPDWR